VYAPDLVGELDLAFTFLMKRRVVEFQRAGVEAGEREVFLLENGGPLERGA
jgi:hypothetical protein